MAEMKMLVGLGNPGPKYTNTRHNMGFRVIDALAQHFGADLKQKKFGARFGSVDLGYEKLILLKPWQFMNLSGQAVASAVGFYKLPLSNVMVVLDDMALDPGRIRIRSKGSAGGHNGLADIINKLGTNEIIRCRIGIGRPEYQLDIDYVLGRAAESEQLLLDDAISNASQAVLSWLEHGLDRTMTNFNGV